MRNKHRRPAGRVKAAGLDAITLQYAAVAAFILAGVVIGALIAGRSELQNNFGFLMQQLMTKEAASKSFINLFASSFVSSALLLCLTFIVGLFALGAPVALAIAAFKGAGIGYSMGYIYISYGLKGFGICALFILPWALLTSLAMLIACREGMRFSFLVLRTILPGSPAGLWNEFRNYCFKYVFCFGFVIAAALIQALSTRIFTALFFL